MVQHVLFRMKMDALPNDLVRSFDEWVRASLARGTRLMSVTGGEPIVSSHVLNVSDGTSSLVFDARESMPRPVMFVGDASPESLPWLMVRTLNAANVVEPQDHEAFQLLMASTPNY